MVGILKRIAVVDLHENNKSCYSFYQSGNNLFFGRKINFIEGSLSFPGIEASITSAKAIEVKYLELLDGNKQGD
ncbi:MAG: peptide deformylase [Rickettsia hoogstraalii]